MNLVVQVAEKACVIHRCNLGFISIMQSRVVGRAMCRRDDSVARSPSYNMSTICECNTRVDAPLLCSHDYQTLMTLIIAILLHNKTKKKQTDRGQPLDGLDICQIPRFLCDKCTSLLFTSYVVFKYFFLPDCTIQLMPTFCFQILDTFVFSLLFFFNPL